MAVGFGLIYSGTKIFHLAHAAVYTTAAYLCLLGLQVLPVARTGLSISVILIVSVFALTLTCILSILLERFVYRPLYQRRSGPLTLLLSSLGLYIVIINILALFFGNETKILNSNSIQSWALGATVVTKMQIIQLAVGVALVSATLLWTKTTLVGRSIRALAENPVLVSVLGDDPKRIRMWAFIVGSALAGAASLLKAFDVGIELHGGLPLVLTAAVAVILGGINSTRGAVIGALLLGLSHNLIAWFLGSAWQDAGTFALLVAVLCFRREGFFTAQLRLEER